MMVGQTTDELTSVSNAYEALKFKTSLVATCTSVLETAGISPAQFPVPGWSRQTDDLVHYLDHRSRCRRRGTIPRRQVAKFSDALAWSFTAKVRHYLAGARPQGKLFTQLCVSPTFSCQSQHNGGYSLQSDLKSTSNFCVWCWLSNDRRDLGSYHLAWFQTGSHAVLWQQSTINKGH